MKIESIGPGRFLEIIKDGDEISSTHGPSGKIETIHNQTFLIIIAISVPGVRTAPHELNKKENDFLLVETGEVILLLSIAKDGVVTTVIPQHAI